MSAIEFKVPIPDGMEIDKENSTFECIKFKPIKPIKPKRWRDETSAEISGYFITTQSSISSKKWYYNNADNYNVFATKKQAKSALAMARISQIMENDERFCGAITNKEWRDKTNKFCIERSSDTIHVSNYISYYFFIQENNVICS